jgi:probable rRNA maturation factor
MQSTHSLSVALQVAPEVEPILASHWGTAWQNKLERALQDAVDALVASERSEESYEICLYLTTDAEIRELNRAYRGVDKATDVLSFGYFVDPNARPEGEALDSPPLGDLVISVETAQRQASLNGHDLLTELLMLALHGTLHLMGYDDATETERATMNARAASTLRRLGYAAREEWYSRYEDA